MRRHVLQWALAASVTASLGGHATAQDSQPVKIGYAVSKTGPSAAGAGVTTIPNYELWVKDVNEAGGLKMPDGSQRKIEVIEYDDRSASDEVVRAVERLATQDNVDFILPPWGTGFNLAIAPLMDRLGYPQLAVTSVTDKAPEFAKRWKKSFWFLGGGKDYAEALAKVIGDAKAAGKVEGKIAVVSVADGFGIDLINAARPAFEEAGLEVVLDKTYPLGTSDFATLINDAKGSEADGFVAFSYPPDTFGMTKAAQVAAFNPAIFYVGVGTAFPIYEKVAGTDITGVMGIGGVNASDPKIADYFQRHTDSAGQPPDSWASAITYASLQMLQQAIERVGVDREAVAEELSTGTFETILGETKLEDNQLRQLWWVGQWQDGKFAAIAPAENEGASEPIIPKPDWKQ
ncbi:amino acid ABC transporter substrate-binding protein [Notoacmeibacter sp. MSK16QG-6]|nr:amino acid ABC transporter substrate-binding protein [Notoacmeibacter sp. MSK16QG-6]MCP1199524.1 amino acid ABC transporter substrate-binding protein [Notoacmeibacter sp. MSK16QG-6]